MKTFNAVFGATCVVAAQPTGGATLILYGVYLLARFLCLVTWVEDN